MNILHVDDMKTDRVLLATLCAEHQWSVVGVETIDEALDLIDPSKFDAVVIDTNTSDSSAMTGYAPASRLARLARLMEIPRCFLSGGEDFRDKKNCTPWFVKSPTNTEVMQWLDQVAQSQST